MVRATKSQRPDPIASIFKGLNLRDCALTAATANTTAPADPRATYRPVPPSPGPDASGSDGASGFNALVDLVSNAARPTAPLALPVGSAAPQFDRPTAAPPVPSRPGPRAPADSQAQDAPPPVATGADPGGASATASGRDTASVGRADPETAPRVLKGLDGRDPDSGAASGAPVVAAVPPTPPIPLPAVLVTVAGTPTAGSADSGGTAPSGPVTSGAPAPTQGLTSGANLVTVAANATAAASVDTPMAHLAVGPGAEQASGPVPGSVPGSGSAQIPGLDLAQVDAEAADSGEITPTLSTLLGVAQSPGAAGLAASGGLKTSVGPVKSLASTAPSAGTGRSAGATLASGGAASLLSGGLDGTVTASAQGVGGQDVGADGGSGGFAASGSDLGTAQATATDGTALPQTPFTPTVDPGNLAAQVAGGAAAAASAGSLPPETPAPAPSRTVTGLASQIIQNVDSKVTRFEVALDPEGMGRVNVSVEISAKGEMSARLSFQHADSANALASESLALRQSLADAGFTLKPEDLTFQSGGQGGAGSFGNGQGFGSSGDDPRPGGGAAAAFGAMNRLADLTDLSAMGSASGAATRGLDIRI